MNLKSLNLDNDFKTAEKVISLPTSQEKKNNYQYIFFKRCIFKALKGAKIDMVIK